MEPPLENKLSKTQLKNLLLSESDRESLEPTDGIKKMNNEIHKINGRNVYFVGSSHIFNASPEDRPRLTQELSSILSEFQEKTKDKKVTYIIEGQKPSRESMSKLPDHESVQLIQNVEENDPEAEIISGEPSITELLTDLKSTDEFSEFNTGVEIDSLGTFNKEDLSLIYFYFRGGVPKTPESKVKVAEIIHQYKEFSFFKTQEVSDLSSLYLEGKITKEEFISKLQNCEVFSQLNSVYEYLHQIYQDENDPELFGPADPSNESNFRENLRRGVSSIAISVNRSRDAHLLQQIQEKTDNGREVLVLYGRSHQIRTRKAIETLAKEN